MSTIAEALNTAMRHHQAGQLPIAEEIYRQVLALQPANVDALHLLGVLSDQMGRVDVALNLLRQAVELNQSEASFHNSLANVLKRNRPAEADAAYRRALLLKPDFAD